MVRDYGIAARTTLRDLMERYLEEVVPRHKSASVETYILRRIMREDPFVEKKLAALRPFVFGKSGRENGGGEYRCVQDLCSSWPEEDRGDRRSLVAMSCSR